MVTRRTWKPSTLRGYEKLWAGVLEPAIGTHPLASFSTVDASDLLTALVKKGHGRRSVQHVRSLMSGIFKRAAARGMIAVNPIHNAAPELRPRAPKPKVAYTIAETVAILNAIQRVDAKLLFALTAILGMRPSEACGLRWEDVAGEVVHVLRAAPYGIPQDSTKSERGQRQLRLIAPVKSLLIDWRRESGDPKKGWLFPRPNGQPIDHSTFVKRWIAPDAKKVCSRWCGLYAGRHGVGTALYDQQGDVRATYQTLGNTLDVTTKTYVKPSTDSGDAGLVALETRIKAEMEKPS